MTSQRVKLVVGCLGTVVLGFAAYDGYRLVQRLRKPLSTNFLNKRCEFIYIPHDYFREPVKDLLNELFQEETLIYSVLYNLKKKLTFTKVSCVMTPLKCDIKNLIFLARICFKISSRCKTFNESVSTSQGHQKSFERSFGS